MSNVVHDKDLYTHTSKEGYGPWNVHATRELGWPCIMVCIDIIKY